MIREAVAVATLSAAGVGASQLPLLGTEAADPLVQAAALAHANCPQLSRDQLVTAVAIVPPESGGRVDAVGDTTITDGMWGPSYGLWQVRSVWDQQGTGQARDADRLTDGAFNARSMCEISGGGTNWRPWTGYTSGAYQAHIPEATAAVDEVLSGRAGDVSIGASAAPAVDLSALGANAEGLQPEFAHRLAQMFAAAPGPVSINSGYRDPETQLSLFLASDQSGKWVAPASRNADGSVTCESNHCKGIAADLVFDGTERFGHDAAGQAPQGTEAWAHDNAGKFGLRFPMDYEPWHVELDAAAAAPGGAPTSPAQAPTRTLGKRLDKVYVDAGGAIDGACAQLGPGQPNLSTGCAAVSGWYWGE